MPPPLATALVHRIFRAYIGIAILITAIQIWILYRDTQDAAQSELRTISKVLEPSVAEALWDFQEPILQSLANGTLENEIVSRIRIGDVANTISVEASRTRGRTETTIPPVHRDLFTRYEVGISEPLGYIDITLNNSFVMARMYRSVASILVGALIKAIGLWAIIVWLARRLLTLPLLHFTNSLQSADPAHSSTPFIPGVANCIEFSKLYDAFGDLMERARDNHELQIEKLAAETRSAEQSRFLANASHDLRQPVHALSLYLGALSGSEMPTFSKTLVEKARQCAQVVENMFHSILDLSKLDAGVVRPHVGAFRLQAIFDDVQVQFDPLARTKCIELHVVRTSLVAWSDLSLVGRIVHNLVSNAVRYTQKGRVVVGCRREGKSIRIEIHDTGPGIPQAIQRSTAAEFTENTISIAAPKHDRQSTGLGLAIAQRLSKLLGHPLRMHTDADRGTSFYLRVPMTNATDQDSVSQVPCRASTAALHHAEIAGKIVLIVDDESSILDATAISIERWGGIPVTASSYADALAVVETPDFVPDALLCDLQLPGERDGNLLITHIREITGVAIPALIITGAHVPDNTDPLSAQILYKPIAEETLRAALISLLSVTADIGVGTVERSTPGFSRTMRG